MKTSLTPLGEGRAMAMVGELSNLGPAPTPPRPDLFPFGRRIDRNRPRALGIEPIIGHDDP
ncbi:MAG TPA: hypothetical protein H9881_15465 [Candidatus Stackebrandtia excrementipullorum]|nr:hypothetical protein [Candidatus Stackebrandtia excrementipullorum]